MGFGWRASSNITGFFISLLLGFVHGILPVLSIFFEDQTLDIR